MNGDDDDDEMPKLVTECMIYSNSLGLTNLFTLCSFQDTVAKIENIDKLCFYHSVTVTDFHLRLLQNIFLRKIVIDSCNLITDMGMRYLNNIHTIELISMSIEDSGLIYLNPKSITLRHMNKITDRGLMYLASIPKVKLIYCDNITKSGLRYLTNASYVEILYTSRFLVMGMGLLYLSSVAFVKIGIHGNSEKTNLTGCNINDLFLVRKSKINKSTLRRLPTIKNLTLMNHEIYSPRGFSYLYRCDNIKMICCCNLDTISLFYLESIPHVLVNCQQYIINPWRIAPSRRIMINGQNGEYEKKLIK